MSKIPEKLLNLIKKSEYEKIIEYCLDHKNSCDFCLGFNSMVKPEKKQKTLDEIIVN